MEKRPLQLSNHITPWLAFALLLILTWPIWRWLWHEWRGNDYYSHGILIVPISAYLAWRRWPLAFTQNAGDYWGLVLTATGIGSYLYLVNQKSLYLATFAALVSLSGLIWTFYGRSVLWQLAFPIGFLMLMIPLPFIERVTLPLALWTGLCSGGLVSWLGLKVAIVGSAITLPNTTLVIGAQCSGINSIISLVTLTVLAAYIFNGPWWGRFSLVLMAVPLAILGNILRVANLLIVAHYLGGDAAFHFYHDYSGPIFFSFVLLLLIPLTRLLQCKTLRLEVL